MILSGVVFAGFAAPLNAENLSDALRAAYRSNPTLQSERARQRITDEQVPQALSGWRPIVDVRGNAGRQWSDTNVSKHVQTDPANVTITLNQPLFRGFKTVESVAAAEANVKAGRQALLGVEQETLFKAIQAYMNVVRDRQILVLRQKNVSVLRKQAQGTSARFSAGELTRTDVAQARASVKGAEAAAAAGRASLNASESNYLSVTGLTAGKLTMPKLPRLPANLDAALAVAQETNPNILSAMSVQDSAEHNIGVVEADLLPQISLQATASESREPSAFVKLSRSASVEGTFTIPLYEGGKVYSGVRQAKQTASQRRIQVIQAVRTVRENVTSAWGFAKASTDNIISVKGQVAASDLALDGVRQEYLVGSRTTSDVLNAEQSSLSARISQVTAEHDQVVNYYQLLAAMGQLTAQNLHLGEIYDPTVNYDAVRNKWIGLSAETIE
jgi:outer membrane protein